MAVVSGGRTGRWLHEGPGAGIGFVASSVDGKKTVPDSMPWYSLVEVRPRERASSS
jgi:hypothetical protein